MITEAAAELICKRKHEKHTKKLISLSFKALEFEALEPWAELS